MPQPPQQPPPSRALHRRPGAQPSLSADSRPGHPRNAAARTAQTRFTDWALDLTPRHLVGEILPSGAPRHQKQLGATAPAQ